MEKTEKNGDQPGEISDACPRGNLRGVSRCHLISIFAVSSGVNKILVTMYINHTFVKERRNFCIFSRFTKNIHEIVKLICFLKYSNANKVGKSKRLP